MNKAILIFGAARLQRSLIQQSKELGFITVGIDPDSNAECSQLLDIFEVVEGNDFETTLAVAKKYKISGLITAATDKPLVMMARVAERLNLPFYSVQTAIISTDKYLMKNAFVKGNVPCARGKLVFSAKDVDEFKFPVILKPRDNSGSRGVILCSNNFELEKAFSEVGQFTKKDNLLIEEFIDGKEYSIESLHFDGLTKVIQYTEKLTTRLPYNVELEHSQPATLSEEKKNKIDTLISQIADTLGFVNCASHTEVKINDKGIFVIETSPRLGGDFITSRLVPLSTGINIEDALLKIAVRENINFNEAKKASLISYLNFPIDKEVVSTISEKQMKERFLSITDFSFDLKVGDRTRPITHSLNRYGYFIIAGQTLSRLYADRDEISKFLKDKLLSD